MCDFIPLIFTCGCDRQLSQEGGQAHICPRCVLAPGSILSRAKGLTRMRTCRSCHNGTVFPTKERNCFTLSVFRSSARPSSKWLSEGESSLPRHSPCWHTQLLCTACAPRDEALVSLHYLPYVDALPFPAYTG